ncbi:MAG: DDE-type integrase/transposase/recombinase [Actinomycetota bacterium]|nr:DDE-type integrase/transposase/recombinase [Actinomycetota bacterium]
MDFHANHRLGLPQRHALCLAIEGGMTLRAAAAAFSVAPATAHRWWHRFRGASHEELRSLAWARDRSSRPRRSPRRLSAAEEAPILRARRETNLGPGRLAGLVRRARSTVWKVLYRHGLSRRARNERRESRRYEWSRPGALLHMDVKRLARFTAPGHRSEGRREGYRRSRGAGWDYLHCVVDDHSRLAYVELHGRDSEETNLRTLRRALSFFAEQGLEAPQAVMTDGAMVYRRSRRFRAALAQAGARHIITPPYTPRWNGKVERFIQSLQNEWAYAHRYPSSTARARSLGSFLRYYNRPQAAQLARRPAADQPRSQRPWAGQLAGWSSWPRRLAPPPRRRFLTHGS